MGDKRLPVFLYEGNSFKVSAFILRHHQHLYPLNFSNYLAYSFGIEIFYEITHRFFMFFRIMFDCSENWKYWWWPSRAVLIKRFSFAQPNCQAAQCSSNYFLTKSVHHRLNVLSLIVKLVKMTTKKMRKWLRQWDEGRNYLINQRSIHLSAASSFSEFGSSEINCK